MGEDNLKYSDSEFEFKECSIKDIDAICEIQEKAFENLQNSNLLRRNSREMLERCLKKPHYTLGAFHNEKLIAFAILYDGETTTENIGYDIGVKGDELISVANIKLIIVLPDYRGNGLQVKLVSKLEKVAQDNGKKILCATVSPDNAYSIKNFEQLGYVFYSQKEKYGGLVRNIYYKKI